MQQRWYAIRRTYRVEDVVYVEATSAQDAKTKAEAGEYEHVLAPEPISGTRLGRPKPSRSLEDLPRDLRWYVEYGEWPE